MSLEMNDMTMYISRDAAGSGLYTLWVNGKPAMDKNGYFKYAVADGHPSLLLMTIHPSKYPWDALKLDRGECIQVELAVTELEASC